MRRTESGELLFTVRHYLVEGNTLLPHEQIESLLAPYKGTEKKVSDIQDARMALEKAYHAMGYPTVLVVLPEQSIETGVIRLQVIESRLSAVTVTGNRWFSTERIMERLPSIRPGVILHEPTVTKELNAINTNPDRQVTPVLKPGEETGTVNLELKVKDRLPLHAQLSADNRGPLTTPHNRMLASVQYTNLWDREHILTLQTMQTPEDWGAVQTYGFSYVAPVKGQDHLLAVYFSKAISNSVLAGVPLPVGSGNVSIAGNATVGGFRYMFPLFPGGTMTHQLSLGVDFKRLEKTTATFPSGLGTAVVTSPIQYTPASLSYTGVRPDPYGVTKGSLTLKGYVAGLVPEGGRKNFGGDPSDPFNQPGDRHGSTGTFGIVRGDVSRNQTLVEDYSMFLQVEGQWANEPLIPAEEFFAGGLDTVRGYYQYETIGDEAVRGRAELYSPRLPLALDRTYSPRLGITLQLVAFYDVANLWVRRPLPGQKDRFMIEGVGGGVRAKLQDYLSVQVDQGWALRDGTVTKKGDSFVHFSVSLSF